MKLSSAAALAMFVTAPAFASTVPFSINFEKAWDYANGDVNGYYAGGTAADGTTGTNLGVSFVNVSGLSNDSSFTYYSGAPSAQGTAYAHDTAYINVAAGVLNALSFFYSSPQNVTGAIRAFSGLNGTGSLLGSYDLVANDIDAYTNFSFATFSFAGLARSFDLSNSSAVLLDNISVIPEPGSVLLLIAGGVALLAGRRRNASSVAASSALARS